MTVFLLCKGCAAKPGAHAFSKHGSGSCAQMFRLALSSHIIIFAFWDTNRDTLSPSSHWETRVAKKRVSGSKWVRNTELNIVNGCLYNLCVLGSWAGVTYLRYTVLMSPKGEETAVYTVATLLYRFLSCLMSRDIFLVVSALQFIVCLFIFLLFGWLDFL